MIGSLLENNMKQDEVQKLIDTSIRQAVIFSTVKYGDTPTDDLQLVPKKYVDGLFKPFYAGYVNSNGTAGSLPTGWTSTQTGTGQYTITHNLASANYSAPVNAFGASAFGKYNSVNANDVQYVFLDTAGSLTDTRFYFVLIPF